MSECVIIEFQVRDILRNAVSKTLRLYPVFLKASLLLQRFVQ
jgi:hypothetical protein